MPRPELLAEKAMLPYVIGHVIGDPNDPVVPMKYVTCTPTLRIKEVNQMPDNLAEPWGWYGILMSDGVSWLDVTMITFDVDELYDDPFIPMLYEAETSYEEVHARYSAMSHEQLWAWLETCPTDGWQVVEIEGDYCRVIFPLDEEDHES